jgi:glutathione-independent formaldehyde dehydrogenase
MGEWWTKGQTIKGGFVQPRPFEQLLKTLIERGNAKPSFVFTKEYRIEEAPQAYKEFEAHKLIKAVFKFDTPKKGLKRKAHHEIDRGVLY